MLKLSTLINEEDLGLRLVAGFSDDDPSVAWAHVSELHDPTPWLVGEELLLTTGLALFVEDDETLKYCQRLVAHEIAALGVSTGATLPHNELPQRLIDAAHRTGLKLVQVAEKTPLQSVVRYVSDAISGHHSEALKRALVAQRQLSDAAVEPNGVAAVLRVLDANTGFSSALYDQTLQLITATNVEAQTVFDDHRDEIRMKLVQNPHWSISTVHENRYSVITPLYAANNLRGIMVTVKEGPLSEHDQALLSTVFSLLRVLLELRYAATLENRKLRDGVARSLCSPELDQVTAQLQLSRLGLKATRLQCLSLPIDVSQAHINGILSVLSDSTTDVLLWKAKSDDLLIMLLCDPRECIDDSIVELAHEFEIQGAGLGSTVNLTDGQLSFNQARKASEMAREKQKSLVIFPQLSSYKALKLLGDSTSRAVFADSVLDPIDEHDRRHGTNLAVVLRAYLNEVGNIENSADVIGIHRHTMRSRLAKISELTMRDLKKPYDLLELWLAIEFREI